MFALSKSLYVRQLFSILLLFAMGTAASHAVEIRGSCDKDPEAGKWGKSSQTQIIQKLTIQHNCNVIDVSQLTNFCLVAPCAVPAPNYWRINTWKAKILTDNRGPGSIDTTVDASREPSTVLFYSGVVLNINSRPKAFFVAFRAALAEKNKLKISVEYQDPDNSYKPVKSMSTVLTMTRL